MYGALRGHLCDSTAFLYFTVTSKYQNLVSEGQWSRILSIAIGLHLGLLFFSVCCEKDYFKKFSKFLEVLCLGTKKTID